MDSEDLFRRRWLILAVLSLSLIIIGLDILIITIGLPDIQTAMSSSASELLWTVNAYTLGFGGLLLLSGGLADRFGRKRLLMIGLFLFLVFSIGAAYSGSPGVLIAFRAGMGVCSALIMPTTLAIIKNVFPPEEQSKAVGIWAGAAGIGVPLGPVIGGVLLTNFWWGSIFMINIPVVAFALIAGAILIPESRDDNHPGLDVVGALLSVGGLVALVFGLIKAPDFGWGDVRTWALIVGAVVLLAAFVRWEMRTAHPMLNGALFRNPYFGGSALAVTCVAFSLFGCLFLITQYLQFALHLAPMATGVRMLAICALIVAGPLGPTLIKKAGLKATVALGLVFIAVAAVVLSTTGVHTEDRALIALGLLGFGLGLCMPNAADTILAASPANQSGAGSAVTDTAMQVGGALGIAVMGSVLTTSYRSNMHVEHLPPSVQHAARDSVGSAHEAAKHLGSAGPDLVASANHAFDHALTNASLVGAAFTALGILITALVLPRQPLKHEEAAAASAEQTAVSPAGQPAATVGSDTD